MRRARTILVAALLALVGVTPGSAEEPSETWVESAPGGGITVHLWFFWTHSCPHCLEAKPFIETLASEPGVAVHALELSGHPENVERFRALAAAVGEPARAVPSFVVCGRMLVGFDADVTPAAIRDGIARCREATPGARAAPNPEPLPPLPGGLDAATLSLPVLALVLGGLDSLNPCAFFVLLFLLSLLVHVRSRARMLAVGAVFVAISGLAYFAFMAAWLNLFLLFGELRAVTAGAGLLAVVLGSINTRDGLRARGSTTLAIPESAKPGLFARMRRLVRAERLSTMIAATVVLALVANLYELLCTAGFPMIFTRVLTLRALPAATYYFYLALYSAVYVAPLLAIVGAFAWTLGSRKLTEREGHLLKLLSGLMMVELGVVLLVAPVWLSRPWVALVLLMLAVAATGFVAHVTRARSETATERSENRR